MGNHGIVFVMPVAIARRDKHLTNKTPAVWSARYYDDAKTKLVPALTWRADVPVTSNIRKELPNAIT